VSGTVQRVAGSTLIMAGLTLAGVELFTLIWQMGAPGQYELIARGGTSSLFYREFSLGRSR
jgi:hypothetical protein